MRVEDRHAAARCELHVAEAEAPARPRRHDDPVARDRAEPRVGVPLGAERPRHEARAAERLLQADDVGVRGADRARRRAHLRLGAGRAGPLVPAVPLPAGHVERHHAQLDLVLRSRGRGAGAQHACGENDGDDTAARAQGRERIPSRSAHLDGARHLQEGRRGAARRGAAGSGNVNCGIEGAGSGSISRIAARSGRRDLRNASIRCVSRIAPSPARPNLRNAAAVPARTAPQCGC